MEDTHHVGFEQVTLEGNWPVTSYRRSLSFILMVDKDSQKKKRKTESDLNFQMCASNAH